MDRLTSTTRPSSPRSRGLAHAHRRGDDLRGAGARLRGLHSSTSTRGCTWCPATGRSSLPPLSDGPAPLGRRPRFNIDYHVPPHRAAEAGSIEHLRLLTGRIFSQRLDRTKPLWEIWLIEGLEDGRFALINKTHHSLVDGVSGVDITTVLFDLDREPAELDDPSREWTPGPEPSDAEVVAGASATWSAPIGSPGGRSSAAPDPRRRPASSEAAEGAGEVSGERVERARVPAQREIGTHRRVIWVGAELAELKEIKDMLGGTVNDVFLAIVSGALAAWLRSRGSAPRALSCGARSRSRSATEDRRASRATRSRSWSAGFRPTRGPGRTPANVSESMKDLKGSKQAVGAEAIARVRGLRSAQLPRSLLAAPLLDPALQPAGLNVPGPQFPLYLLGRELQELVRSRSSPRPGPGDRDLRYNGHVRFGLIGDYDAMADLDDLAEYIAISPTSCSSGRASRTRPTRGDPRRAPNLDSAPGLRGSSGDDLHRTRMAESEPPEVGDGEALLKVEASGSPRTTSPTASSATR